MDLIVLLIKYLPQIISAWVFIQKEIKSQEELSEKERLRNGYKEALQQSKVSGNTDALRDFVSRVRESSDSSNA